MLRRLFVEVWAGLSLVTWGGWASPSSMGRWLPSAKTAAGSPDARA